MEKLNEISNKLQTNLQEKNTQMKKLDKELEMIQKETIEVDKKINKK